MTTHAMLHPGPNARALRWIARGMSLGLFGLFMAFIAGEGAGNRQLGFSEWLQWLTLLVALGGLLVAWRWERLGGVLVVGGVAGFYVANVTTAGRSPQGWMFPVLALTGVLFLVSAFTRAGGHRGVA